NKCLIGLTQLLIVRTTPSRKLARIPFPAEGGFSRGARHAYSRRLSTCSMASFSFAGVVPAAWVGWASCPPCRASVAAIRASFDAAGFSTFLVARGAADKVGGTPTL